MLFAVGVIYWTCHRASQQHRRTHRSIDPNDEKNHWTHSARLICLRSQIPLRSHHLPSPWDAMEALFAEELGRTPPDSPPPAQQHPLAQIELQPQLQADAPAVEPAVDPALVVQPHHVRIHIHPEPLHPPVLHSQATCPHPLHHAHLQPHQQRRPVKPNPSMAADCPQCALAFDAERRRSLSRSHSPDLDPAAVAARAQAKEAQLRAEAVAAAQAEVDSDAAQHQAVSAAPAPLGLILLAWSSGILAVCICTGGAFMLSADNHALLISEGGCNQLFLWSILFILFEGMYLILLILNAFNYSESNFHAKRAKTSFLLIVLLMSVGMWSEHNTKAGSGAREGD